MIIVVFVVLVYFVLNENSYSEWFSLMKNVKDAKKLEKEIRVLCLVMTYPSNHNTSARRVYETWGKRCTYIRFLTTQEDDKIPTYVVEKRETYRSIWGKTKVGFRRAYEDYQNDVDWFMKADDDTYVILENLRYLLSDQDTNEPLFFGLENVMKKKRPFMSGGAGYVLSKEALRRFSVHLSMEKSRNNSTISKLCRVETDNLPEDMEMGNCMRSLGVKFQDTRDNIGRFRFFRDSPEKEIFKGKKGKNWMFKYEREEGIRCCSDLAISFHHLSPKWMLMLEYFVYHIRPYGYNFEEEFGISTRNRV